MKSIRLDDGQLATLDDTTKHTLLRKAQALFEKEPTKQNYYLGIKQTATGLVISPAVMTTNPDFTVFKVVDRLSRYNKATLIDILAS